MGAEVIPFPIACRRAFISKQAKRAVELDHAQAEKHIQQQLNCQRAAFRRRGIAENLIEEQLRSMESAVRVAMWDAVFNAPGAR